jgi:hypothetical protein
MSRDWKSDTFNKDIINYFTNYYSNLVNMDEVYSDILNMIYDYDQFISDYNLS